MRSLVYALIFFLTLHSTIGLYTNSTFLSQFSTTQELGYIYIASAALSLLALIFGHRIGAAVGNVRLAILAGSAEAIAMILLAISNSQPVLIISFCVSQASIALLFYAFDVFLESYTKNGSTGGVRGTYLTVINSAFLVGPIIGTQILIKYNFEGVYALGACLMLAVLFATVIFLRDFEDPEYAKTKIGSATALLRERPDVVKIILSFAALWMFYIIAIIYAPLYFTQYLGLSTAELGILLAIGLLPFVIVQIPLGKLADAAFGEKEFLVCGFIIMAVTSFLVPYMVPLGFLALAMLVFVGRIGAASAEIMCDTYFFKQVNAENIGVITTYRSMAYLAYVVVPLIIGPAFVAFGYAIAFPVGGVFALIGIVPSLLLKDTK